MANLNFQQRQSSIVPKKHPVVYLFGICAFRVIVLKGQYLTHSSLNIDLNVLWVSWDLLYPLFLGHIQGQSLKDKKMCNCPNT